MNNFQILIVLWSIKFFSKQICPICETSNVNSNVIVIYLIRSEEKPLKHRHLPVLFSRLSNLADNISSSTKRQKLIIIISRLYERVLVKACNKSTFGLWCVHTERHRNDTEIGNDNYGFHCNMWNTSHWIKTMSLMPLATFNLFIGIGLGVAQCENMHFFLKS